MGKIMTCGIAALVLIVAALSGCTTATTGSPREAYCPPAAVAPVIDGVLDDPAWRAAPTFYLCGIGYPSPVFPAMARAVWTDEALYVAFESLDPDVISGVEGRDVWVWQEGDGFGVILAPPSGVPGRIELEVNPRGGMLDVGWRKGVTWEEAKAWDWKGMEWKTRVNGTADDDRADAGWTAEIRLPWASLGRSAPEAGDRWSVLFAGVNRVRLFSGRMTEERKAWPFLKREDFNDRAQMGSLTFVPAPGPGAAAEGVGRASADRKRPNPSYCASYRGWADFRLLSEKDAEGALDWETQPVPDGNGPVTFCFAGKLREVARVPDSAAYDLWVDGQPAVRFGAVWDGKRFQSDEGFALERRLRLDPDGRTVDQEHLYLLTIPRERLKAGQPVQLSLRHACPERATFILVLWTDAALWEGSLGK
jgi:hypothetical protein